MPSIDQFQKELRSQFECAEKRRAKNIVVNCGELHLAVGGFPGPHEGLQICSEMMKGEMRSGDVIIGDLDSRRGAALTIRYQLPRVRKPEFAAETLPLKSETRINSLEDL